MPIDKNRYPANWKEISYRIRTERAGNKCEWCGAPNGALIYRDKEHPEQFTVVPERLSQTEFNCIFGGKPSEMSRVIKVVLTVAHIDHDTTNNDDSNLAALCQRCHLNHDAQYHAGNAKITRQKAKLAALKESGQLSLFQED